jgi:osmotically inducible protein OsmC
MAHPEPADSADPYARRMATTRIANTHWEGSLLEGTGTVEIASSGIGTKDVTRASRSEEPNGRTSPEELIAAAHSSCFSMALSNGLAKNGHPPTSVDTRAEVTFQPGEGITGIALTVRASVPGLSADDFEAAAQDAKANCPVSQALAGTTITLTAELV